MLEAEHLATLRIDARHDVPDRAVLTSGIHGLKNEEYGIAVVRIVHLLQLVQLLGVLVEKGAIGFLGLVKRFTQGRALEQ